MPVELATMGQPIRGSIEWRIEELSVLEDFGQSHIFVIVLYADRDPSIFGRIDSMRSEGGQFVRSIGRVVVVTKARSSKVLVEMGHDEVGHGEVDTSAGVSPRTHRPRGDNGRQRIR